MRKQVMTGLFILSAALTTMAARAEWGNGLGNECKTTYIPQNQQSGWPCVKEMKSCCDSRQKCKSEDKPEAKAVPDKEWRLTGVTFETGSDRLKSESHKPLNEALHILKDHPSVTVEIQGHTDNVGAPAANMDLSQKRAAAVKQYLTDKGIASNRLEAKGYGETQPIADNNTEAGRSQNRRIEFKVLTR